MIPETLLETHSYTGVGFKPLIFFNSWRVAVLNYKDDLHPDRNDTFERHPETDEVFFLFRGRAILFLSEGGQNLTVIHTQVMEPGIFYNVKPSTWHTVVLSRDASIIIVENADTSEKNSQFIKLESSQHRIIQETARREHPGDWD